MSLCLSVQLQTLLNKISQGLPCKPPGAPQNVSAHQRPVLWCSFPRQLCGGCPSLGLSPYPEDLATSRAPCTGDVRSEARGLPKGHLPGVWCIWAAPVLMLWWMAEMTKTHCLVLFLCADAVLVQCKGRPLSLKQPAAICALPGQPCYIELRASSHWHK